MIKITVKESAAYGRKRYEPDCALSEVIMKLIPKRSTFTAEDVKFLKDSGWTVEILEKAGWEPKR
mgnify:CR=1 FL=1